MGDYFIQTSLVYADEQIFIDVRIMMSHQMKEESTSKGLGGA